MERGLVGKTSKMWNLPFGGIGDASIDVPFMLMIWSNADLFRFVSYAKVKITPITNQFIILFELSHHWLNTLRFSRHAFHDWQQIVWVSVCVLGPLNNVARLNPLGWRNTRYINFVVISIHTKTTTKKNNHEQHTALIFLYFV